MQDLPEKPRRGLHKWLNMNTVGLAVLTVTVCVSVYHVLNIQRKDSDPNKKVLRISHWQLELGYRSAMQTVIDAYQKLHPDVEIIQVPITEKVYGQWLNTNLISNMAPDLAEVGYVSKLASDEQCLARFFLPLTEVINRPNPYNKGTSIQDLPWRETFRDGMRGGYQKTLQDYFFAPTSLGTVRLFYNKQLLREATGSDQPPRTLGELLQACRAIREYGRKIGKEIIPIAGGKGNLDTFSENYKVSFTANFEEELDLNLDGGIVPNESYIGLLRGQVGMRAPAIAAYYACLRAICNQFAEGFTGIERDLATYSFVIGKAGMIATGSWNAKSLFDQAKFEIGIINFPLPAPGERWHEYIVGQFNEAAGMAGSCNYGVYKFSRNKDLAIDFLQFLTSQKVNQLLNQQAEWLPVIFGAATSPRMRPFIPDPRGFTCAVDFSYGTYVITIYRGLLERFLGGEIEYGTFANAVEAALKSPPGGDRAWAMEYDTQRRLCRNQDRVLAIQAIRCLMDPSAQDAGEKYRRILLQQVRANNGEDIRHLFEVVRKKPIPEI